MSILSLIKRAPKRLSAAVLMIAAAIIIPTAAFAWGPNRDTFTLAKPSDHVQFNSIVDASNPNLKDERNFVGIREVGSANVWYDDVTAQPGKEYLVRMYVHNNAAENLNLTAQNVTAKFNLPTTTAKSIQINGFLSASNVGAKAGVAGAYAEVYDHATFNSNENFNLAYTAGSLKYENNAFGAAGTPLPESIFTSTGAKLGYDTLDGNIKGCFQYAGYVTFKVKPQFATPTNDFTVQKEVRKAGDKTFVESVETKAGDKLNYRIIYTNTGTAPSSNVILKDKLPAGVSFVPGTVKILNANNLGGALIKDGDTLFTTGANIGHYTPGSNAIVIFDATVDQNVKLPLCGPNTLRNIASAQPEGQTPKEDGANVTIPKECAPEVAYTCDALDVTRISRTEFRFVASYTVKNATFKNLTFIIRDAKGNEVERKTTTEKTLNYTRNVVGKYTVETALTVTVNGQDKTVTSGDCKKEFEVPSTPDYCPIPGKEYLPKDSKDCIDTTPELPHTGAGENIVAFVGLGALIAGITYYVASRRALNQ